MKTGNCYAGRRAEVEKWDHQEAGNADWGLEEGVGRPIRQTHYRIGEGVRTISLVLTRWAGYIQRLGSLIENHRFCTLYLSIL